MDESDAESARDGGASSRACRRATRESMRAARTWPVDASTALPVPSGQAATQIAVSIATHSPSVVNVVPSGFG